MRKKKAVSSRLRRKRILKEAKGFYGDRKNHFRQAKPAVMKARHYNTVHRKHNKRNFRSLWITRIAIATKIFGISYSKFLHGLKRAGCEINRKILANLAMNDINAFSAVVDASKKVL